MYLYFAPLEGLTTALYRTLHFKYFRGVDRYYTPFISPTADHRFTPKELREILPEHNPNTTVIPQILTKNSQDFIWAAAQLHQMGYHEINLNAGCPSGTVTAKGKGSGLLADLGMLKTFLDEIFSQSPCKISVKTRLGIEHPEEFERILELYNQYPMTELIIHPRVRKDFYRNSIRKDAFTMAFNNAKMPVTYNGSIVTVHDHTICCKQWPQLHAIMIGQGLVSDPALAQKIRYNESCSITHLREFHDELLDGYASLFQSRNNAVKRMKEFWFYFICCFDQADKHKKLLLKSQSAAEYDQIVSRIFSELALLPASRGNW